MKKTERLELEARLRAQQVISFKLFEMLLFMKPALGAKALVFLERYVAELEAEGDLESGYEAHALTAQLTLLRDAKNHHESAGLMREALARARSRPHPPKPKPETE